MDAASTRSFSILRLAAVCASGMLFGLPALAAAAAPAPAEAQSRYEHERARCLGGQSGQAQETCLKEAGAALDLAKKGQLTDDGHYRKNAKERCDVFAGDDRRDCMARVKGAANTSESGGVKSGGIIRETVTVEPGAMASAPSR